MLVDSKQSVLQPARTSLRFYSLPRWLSHEPTETFHIQTTASITQDRDSKEPTAGHTETKSKGPNSLPTQVSSTACYGPSQAFRVDVNKGTCCNAAPWNFPRSLMLSKGCSLVPNRRGETHHSDSSSQPRQWGGDGHDHTSTRII